MPIKDNLKGIKEKIQNTEELWETEINSFSESKKLHFNMVSKTSALGQIVFWL